MKLLIIRDSAGNGADYQLSVPESMDRWRVDALLDFLDTPLETSRDEGYLVQPLSYFRHETLRRLVRRASSTLNPPVTFVQHDRLLDRYGDIDLTEPVSLVRLERDTQGSRGDIRRLSLYDSNRQAFDSCREHVVRAVDTLFDFSAYPIMDSGGAAIESLNDVADDFLERLDPTHQMRFLYRIADIIHTHPFENISKIIDGIPFRSGWEMWEQMAMGFGGICGEKTAAFKFICDVLDVPSFHVAGAKSRIPDDFDAQLKRYVASGGEEEQPVWIQHHLPGIRIAGRDYLIDSTNGNVPLLFLDDAAMNRLIACRYRARMVYTVEELNLRRISKWTGDALLTLSEFHVPDLHFQYMFDQGLGLHISSQAYIGIFFDWGGERSARMQHYYASQAKRLRMRFPRFLHGSNLHSIPDKSLMKLLETVLYALRERYEQRHYTGDFTFVIQPLTSEFWRRPHVSASVARLLWDPKTAERSERAAVTPEDVGAKPCLSPEGRIPV